MIGLAFLDELVVSYAKVGWQVHLEHFVTVDVLVAIERWVADENTGQSGAR
jgi:hypothetical protein